MGPVSWIIFTITSNIGLSLILYIREKEIALQLFIFILRFNWSDYKSEYKNKFHFYNLFNK